MGDLLREKLRQRDALLGNEWTELLEWLEKLGRSGVQRALPGELFDSPTHQVLVGTQGSSSAGDNHWSHYYCNRVMVRLGAVVVYRETDVSRGGNARGDWDRRSCNETVYVAVPADADVVRLLPGERNDGFFLLENVTEVVQENGPWWDILARELRPYLNALRRFQAAEAAEEEQRRQVEKDRQAEKLRAAAEAVENPRPLRGLHADPEPATPAVPAKSGCMAVVFLLAITAGALWSTL